MAELNTGAVYWNCCDRVSRDALGRVADINLSRDRFEKLTPEF
jgi:hypothetical protein